MQKRIEDKLPTSQEKKETPKFDINETFSKKEFLKVIKKLKNGKAEGFDATKHELLKNAPATVLDLVYRFVNLCMKKSLIPYSWCLDIINPIHKDGARNDPRNYRGICIFVGF